MFCLLMGLTSCTAGVTMVLTLTQVGVYRGTDPDFYMGFTPQGGL
ncbi:hypothetical protein CAURIC_07410 [Corynebacterium auriscanis]|nr:hypothetical protein CAURIC_07410 [Corynebacterium auriscanis]